MRAVPYHLGLPIWSHRPWVGVLYSADAKPADYLGQYARAFDAVEGNSTFYGLPTVETVERWRAAVPPGFRFCFKPPRLVSHDDGLVGQAAKEALDAFLERLAPLGAVLGPFLLQLPPSFDSAGLDDLDSFLGAAIPAAAVHGLAPGWAVEVRSRRFLDGAAAAELSALLARHNASRAIFDSRGMRAAAAAPDTWTTGVHDELAAARAEAITKAIRQKPSLPPPDDFATDSGPNPILRFGAHPHPPENDALIAEWAPVLAQQSAAGRTPYVFVHAPGDVDAPAIAARWREAMAQAIGGNFVGAASQANASSSSPEGPSAGGAEASSGAEASQLPLPG